MLSSDPLFSFDYGPHDGAHSAENEIPFLQAALPDPRVVLGLFGGHEHGLDSRVARGLARLAEHKDIVVIASTDLLHDPDYARVSETDRSTMSQLAEMDEEGLAARWSPDCQVCCGIRPVRSAIAFARHQGCTQGMALAYRNSGDDFPENRGERVVGYGAAVYSLPRSTN